MTDLIGAAKAAHLLEYPPGEYEVRIPVEDLVPLDPRLDDDHRIYSIHLGKIVSGGKACSPDLCSDSWFGEQTYDSICQLMNAAVVFGSRHVNFHLGFLNNDSSLELGVQRLDALIDHARKKGVLLRLENDDTFLQKEMDTPRAVRNEVDLMVLRGMISPESSLAYTFDLEHYVRSWFMDKRKEELRDELGYEISYEMALHDMAQTWPRHYQEKWRDYWDEIRFGIDCYLQAARSDNSRNFLHWQGTDWLHCFGPDRPREKFCHMPLMHIGESFGYMDRSFNAIPVLRDRINNGSFSAICFEFNPRYRSGESISESYSRQLNKSIEWARSVKIDI